jgi:hypothetical protein
LAQNGFGPLKEKGKIMTDEKKKQETIEQGEGEDTLHEGNDTLNDASA